MLKTPKSVVFSKRGLANGKIFNEKLFGFKGFKLFAGLILNSRIEVEKFYFALKHRSVTLKKERRV